MCETTFTSQRDTGAKPSFSWLPLESQNCCHGPVVDSVCFIIPTKQGCEALTDGVPSEAGSEVWAGAVTGGPGGDFPRTWEQTCPPRPPGASSCDSLLV